MTEPTPKRRPGQPTKYTPDLANTILSAIASGTTMANAARENGIHIDTMYEWSDKHPEFSEALTRAKALAAETYAGQIIDIADDSGKDWIEYETASGRIRREPNNEMVQRSRLRVETRKYLMEKWAPKAYGDVQRLELTGAGGGPILLESIAMVAVARTEADIGSASHKPQVIDNAENSEEQRQLPHHPSHKQT